MVLGKSHFAEVALALPPFKEREGVSISAMTQRWRELTGPIPDAVELSFSAAAFTTGEAINFELTGRDVDELRRFAATLRGELARYNGVYDITDSFRAGKQEIKLALTEEGRALGADHERLGQPGTPSLLRPRSSAGSARRG